MNDVNADVINDDPYCTRRFRQLYKIAGIAAIAMLAVMAIQIAVYTIWPLPSSVEDWFNAFQNSWVLGLLHLDFLYIINNTIVAIMYLALFFSMRRGNEGALIVALVLGVMGVVAYYASNPAFEMLSLSGQFVQSASGIERTAYLAAGQMLIAGWKGTAFDIYYILSAISLLMFAGAMLKSAAFGKAAAISGLVSGVLMLIPSSAGSIGVVFSLASLIPWAVFTLLVVRVFLRLARQPEPAVKRE